MRQKLGFCSSLVPSFSGPVNTLGSSLNDLVQRETSEFTQNSMKAYDEHEMRHIFFL
jgi:hypothetical protein